MLGTACFFNWFLDKKRTKLEISGRFSGKDRYNRPRIFPKRRDLIWWVHLCILDGCCQTKEQNASFQTDFHGKPNILERLISQKATVFYDRYSVFFNRLLDKKRTKLKTSSRFSGRDPYHRTTIFWKRNGFYDRYIFF